MAQGLVQLAEALVFGQSVIFPDLSLPALETAQTPGGGGDLFDVVSFEEGAWGKLLHPVGLELFVAFGVFAECGQDDVSGEEAVRGSVACGNGFAGFGGRHRRTRFLAPRLYCGGFGSKREEGVWREVHGAEPPCFESAIPRLLLRY